MFHLGHHFFVGTATNMATVNQMADSATDFVVSRNSAITKKPCQMRSNRSRGNSKPTLTSTTNPLVKKNKVLAAKKRHATIEKKAEAAKKKHATIKKKTVAAKKKPATIQKKRVATKRNQPDGAAASSNAPPAKRQKVVNKQSPEPPFLPMLPTPPDDEYSNEPPAERQTKESLLPSPTMMPTPSGRDLSDVAYYDRGWVRGEKIAEQTLSDEFKMRRQGESDVEYRSRINTEKCRRSRKNNPIRYKESQMRASAKKRVQRAEAKKANKEELIKQRRAERDRHRDDHIDI